MAQYDAKTKLSDEQLELVKRQLAPVMGRMTRLQIFEMADFMYAEARRRRSQSQSEDWRFEISI